MRYMLITIATCLIGTNRKLTMSQLITIRAGAAGFAGLKHLRETLKLAVRARLHRRATYAWLQLLNSHPLFLDLAKARPRLIYKIYRPYLSNTMNCAQRVQLLQEHYRFIFRQGLGPLTVQAARGAVVLAAIEGKNGLDHHLQLRAIEPMEREGELVLQLMQAEQLVYGCAFSFFEGEHGMVLGVGCMQGPRGERGLQLIKDATRELHGLRPKNLMIKLLGQIAHDHGCAQLRLVGNANRAVCGAARQGKVHADYDALWQELDASPAPMATINWPARRWRRRTCRWCRRRKDRKRASGMSCCKPCQTTSPAGCTLQPANTQAHWRKIRYHGLFVQGEIPCVWIFIAEMKQRASTPIWPCRKENPSLKKPPIPTGIPRPGKSKSMTTATTCRAITSCILWSRSAPRGMPSPA
jgi:uncharacterized protein VirK/YbjX